MEQKMPHQSVDIVADEKRAFRFSVKSLLLAVALFAFVLVAGLFIHKWSVALPTIPLADAVTDFNTRHADDPVGKNEPALTEAEVVASITSQLPNLSASMQVKEIYSNIVRTRKIPRDASLHAMPGWELGDGTYYTVWWINLDVTTGRNSGYGLRIREDNAPTAKPKDEPRLKRRNLTWISETP
jgi:hypothetical protein